MNGYWTSVPWWPKTFFGRTYEHTWLWHVDERKKTVPKSIEPGLYRAFSERTMRLTFIQVGPRRRNGVPQD